MHPVAIVALIIASSGTVGGYTLPEPLRESQLRRESQLIAVGVIKSTRELGEPTVGKCWEWQVRRAELVVESIAKGRTKATVIRVVYRTGVRNLVKQCTSRFFPAQLTVGERYRLYLRRLGRRRSSTTFEIVHWNGVVRLVTKPTKGGKSGKK